MRPKDCTKGREKMAIHNPKAPEDKTRTSFLEADFSSSYKSWGGVEGGQYHWEQAYSEPGTPQSSFP